MTKTWSPTDIEAIDLAWTNNFAAKRGWEEHDILIPDDELNQFFNLLTGTKVLDSGCGWGSYVYMFLDAELDYVGLDYSSEMIKAASKTNPHATFVHASFRSIPFPTEHFDGIWSCCALSALPKLQLTAVLKEHHRVLKSGGVMICIMPSPGFSHEEMVMENGQPLLYQSSYLAPELISHFREAGFTVTVLYNSVFPLGAMALVARK